ncbi:sensor histidine kinase [Nocardioides sp. W7]|uniref:sensor histidine kinase n=1 Tax=Nocardioides sp. W7 TaxID=2931390 RepID=UPI001FD12D92|nr:sensor histidine kinase [Nocardioides sp. W7]
MTSGAVAAVTSPRQAAVELVVTDGGRPRAAAALAVVAWGLAVLSLPLLLLARPPVDANLLFFVVDVSVACLYGTVGAVVLGRRTHPVAWLLALAGVGGGLSAFGYAYDAWAAAPGGLPPSDAVATLSWTGWVPGTLALFLVVPWLVRDHPLGRARWGVAVGVILCLGFLPVSTTSGQAYVPMLLAVSGHGLLTAAAVERRRRTGPLEERNGLGWLALGTAALAASFLLLLPWIPAPMWAVPTLHLASQAVFPAAVLVVVLRNRLWGLDLVVSRAVLVGLLTTVLLALYLGATALVTQVLPGEEPARLIGAGVVAVAVQPLRLRLGRRVDLLVHGEAADPGRVVRRIGSQLTDTGTVEDLLSGLAEDVGRSMRLSSVTVHTDETEPVRWGEPAGLPTVVPLRHRGEHVGDLEVTATAGEQLSPRDLRNLDDLASVVAAAVAVVGSAADVERMRERLSQVRLEERRVIRREIHDGLGPSLAGIRLGLQGARNLLTDHPEAGRELLAHLQGEVDVAVEAVRTLSHHLLPPVLEELGLEPALRELVHRYDDSRLSVSLDAGPVGGLATWTAATAYAIASEALTNAVRHASATTCRLTLRILEDRLVLEVADNGRGVATDAVPGVGTRSMRERATEQGGTVEVTARPEGGTAVTAVLPLVGTSP